MRVTCEHCAQALAIPDEKVPNRAFSLTCPKCKGIIKVDPTAATPVPVASAPEPPTTAGPAEAAGARAGSAPHTPTDPGSQPAEARRSSSPASGFAPKASPTPAPAPGLDVNDFTPLHALRPTEQAVLDQVVPLVFLVGFTDASEDERVTSGLGRLGWNTIERHASLDDALGAMAAATPGIVMLRLDSRPALPAPALSALDHLSPAQRRRIFIAALGPGMHALDGQLAFLLQVDCVLDAHALYRFPADLRRAVLVRQQRYRHWDLDDD